jgi:hypothetical protein
MDIAGTKKKIQRATKVAEESYKKMNEMLERMQQMQEDLSTTSTQVDEMEVELAQQRAILESIAAEQGIDTEAVLEEADLLASTDEDGDTPDPSKMATSRPSSADE